MGTYVLPFKVCEKLVISKQMKKRRVPMAIRLNAVRSCDH